MPVQQSFDTGAVAYPFTHSFGHTASSELSVDDDGNIYRSRRDVKYTHNRVRKVRQSIKIVTGQKCCWW